VPLHRRGHIARYDFHVGDPVAGAPSRAGPSRRALSPPLRSPVLTSSEHDSWAAAAQRRECTKGRACQGHQGLGLAKPQSRQHPPRQRQHGHLSPGVAYQVGREAYADGQGQADAFARPSISAPENSRRSGHRKINVIGI
jgi:hypothetical protein